MAVRRLIGVTLAVVASLSARGQTQGPLTAERVDDGVERAVAWLRSMRDADGTWEDSPGAIREARYRGGSTALVSLALLSAGVNPNEADLQGALDWLEKQRPHTTYVLSLRAQALALTNVRKYRDTLQNDMRDLLAGAHPSGNPNAGGYGYYCTGAELERRWFDNSNSQFGVLGVWMAASAGAKSPNFEGYWQRVESYWLKGQAEDGGWKYRPDRETTGSMTAGGLATLFIVIDQAFNSPRATRSPELDAAVKKGLEWFERRFSPDNPSGGGQWKHYYLYGVERAGRASGRKRFGRHDWFRIGAADLLSRQKLDGSWDADIHDTAFAVLFLTHGRAPLLMNKLEFATDWDRNLRDVENLTRFAERAFERPFNWQIVSLDGPVSDLLEAPALYITGKGKLEFGEPQVEKLRDYVARGGFLLISPADDDAEFVASAKAELKRIIPDHVAVAIDATHPLFSGGVQYPITNPPKAWEVSNGLRSLAVLIEEPIGDAWRTYRLARDESRFRLGLDAYLYATDRVVMRNRLKTPIIELESHELDRTVRLARIEYDGDWNIEPAGWERVAAAMNNNDHVRLLVSEGVRLDSDRLAQYRVAHVTGKAPLSLSDAERAGLRRFIEAGGVLIADAAGGSAEFAKSVESEVAAAMEISAYDPRAWRAIPASSAILTGAGLGAETPVSAAYRRAGRRLARGSDIPPLRVFEYDERIAVVLSPLDISVGLLGAEPFDLAGFDGATCLGLMRNLVLFGDTPGVQKGGVSNN
ncbi:MAG: DUF4159 domain-containing protein [Phycisphaerales bacterium]|nr:DUF4159 domain-containing protein [Phycisphaerales bacterium]